MSIWVINWSCNCVEGCSETLIWNTDWSSQNFVLKVKKWKLKKKRLKIGRNWYICLSQPETEKTAPTWDGGEKLWCVGENAEGVNSVLFGQQKSFLVLWCEGISSLSVHLRAGSFIHLECSVRAAGTRQVYEGECARGHQPRVRETPSVSSFPRHITFVGF